MAGKRRHRGEGASYRACSERWGCPPTEPTTAANGRTIMRRPEHSKTCRAPWAYSIDKGIVGGKRVRHVVTAASKRNRKARDLRRRILAS